MPARRHDASPPAIAGLLRRGVAAAVDLAILLPLLGLLGWIWVRLFDVRLPPGSLPIFDFLVQLHVQDDPLVWGGILLALLVSGSYFLIAHLFAWSSPGMQLLGLAVVDVHGRPPGLGRSLVRISGVGLGLAYFGLGSLWVAFDPLRQGFGDKLSGCRVIRRNTQDI